MLVLKVQPQGPVGSWVDAKCERLMRYASGAPLESTQRTHFWNNHHLGESQLSHLHEELMVFTPGDQGAKKIPRIPILGGALSHLTRFGGWQNYLVLEPGIKCTWYIGWKWPGGGGVSRIPVDGPVKVLEGPDPVYFFAISHYFMVQIPLCQIGKGKLGNGGDFSQVPLF